MTNTTKPTRTYFELIRENQRLIQRVAKLEETIERLRTIAKRLLQTQGTPVEDELETELWEDR